MPLMHIFDMNIILAAIYIPPPYSGEVLKKVLAFVSVSPMVPILLGGDFNNYLHPYWDKMHNDYLAECTAHRPCEFTGRSRTAGRLAGEVSNLKRILLLFHVSSHSL